MFQKVTLELFTLSIPKLFLYCYLQSEGTQRSVVGREINRNSGIHLTTLYSVVLNPLIMVMLRSEHTVLSLLKNGPCF